MNNTNAVNVFQNSKSTLTCRPLVLVWKGMDNKIWLRNWRERVWTGSTSLLQISNFDSKLHLKSGPFYLKKAWKSTCISQPKLTSSITMLIDNSKSGVNSVVVNKTKRSLSTLSWRKMVWSCMYLCRGTRTFPFMGLVAPSLG